MSKIIIDIKNKHMSIVDLTPTEIAEVEEIRLLSELDGDIKPSTEELEQARFELKTITLLSELGVI